MNEVIPDYDWSEALKLSPEERMRRCVDQVKLKHTEEGTWDFSGVPPVPVNGASEKELDELEVTLGIGLPDEL